MKNAFAMAAVMVSMVLGMACGGVGGNQAACTTVSGSSKTCFEWSGTAWAGAGTYDTACTQAGGTVSAACDRSGSVGGCRTGPATLSYTLWFYGPGSSASDVTSYCNAASGTVVTP